MGAVVNALKYALGYELAQIIVYFAIVCCAVCFGFGFVVYRDSITRQYKIVSSGGERLGVLMMVFGGVLLVIILLLETLGYLSSTSGVA